ncbi:DNA primase family protein [Rhodococcus sp. NM-2]|uniref:DNA primase family protein n=1 Tax=Rhodococcus sp. NM-2 TaxID=3401174 RepID=UPI003AAC0E43
MAYRLAEQHASRLMFVSQVGWYRYDGTRWTPDTKGYAKRAVLRELRRALAESLTDATLRKDVARCESATGIAGVLEIASALEEFAFEVGDLDPDPYLLNCANGTLNLHSMTLWPHDPADRITKVTRAAYQPRARSETWTNFLETSLPKVEVRTFLQGYVGSALAGRVLEHKLCIMTGAGRNGKGVAYGALGHALGDYATVAEPDLLMHREGAHPTGQMDLMGVRWVVISESDKGRKLAEATVKRLTGGDKIRARRMRQDFVEFDPSHTAALVTNFLPKISGDDPALWARLLVVPFDVVIPPEKRDPLLPQKLEADVDAILTWAVEGWVQYKRDGLNPPEAVTAATSEYRADSDAVGRFITECCHRAAKFKYGKIYEAFSSWAASQGLPPIAKPDFRSELESKGFTVANGAGNQVYVHGLVLAAADDD